MNEVFFKMSDEQYFKALHVVEDSMLESLNLNNCEGIYIGCPGNVDLNTDNQLPLLLYENRSFQDIRALPLDMFAAITAVDLDRGIFYSNFLQPSIDEPAPRPSEKTDLPIPKGSASQCKVFNLRELLDLPWIKCNLLVTLFLYDRHSNRVAVCMQDKKGSSESIRKEILDSLDDQTPPFVTFPERDPFPQYKKLPDSPELPEPAGIALYSDPSFSVDASKRYVVYGAFNIPVLPYELNRETENKDFTAVVPMSFLLSDSVQGIIGTLNVSIPAKLNEKNQSYSVGYFAFDLKKHFNFNSSPRTYIIHVFSRSFMQSNAFSIK